MRVAEKVATADILSGGRVEWGTGRSTPMEQIAFGVDRIVAIMAGRESIREVIAFPKTASGADPLSGAPTAIDAQALRELGIRIA